jgi:hypothetical protein
VLAWCFAKAGDRQVMEKSLATALAACVRGVVECGRSYGEISLATKDQQEGCRCSAVVEVVVAVGVEER